MYHLSTFTGIGGVDIAAEAAGFHTVAMVEIDSFCRCVLAENWPYVPIYQDIRDFTAERCAADGCLPGRVDLLTGGPPCQPSSVAGRRRGAADERWLWPDFLRVVGFVRPTWVVAENPPGILTLDAGRAFGTILDTLAEMGYSAGWCCYGAADVGASQQRDRVFIMAHAGGEAFPSGNRPERPAPDGQAGDGPRIGGKALADAGSAGRNGRSYPRGDERDREDAGWTQAAGRSESSSTGLVADATPGMGQRTASRTGGHATQRDESNFARPAQSCLGSATHGLPGWVDSRWVALRGQAQHEWEAARTIAARTPYRVAQLRALGNAVVPAQIYPLLQAIADYEQVPA